MFVVCSKGYWLEMFHSNHVWKSRQMRCNCFCLYSRCEVFWIDNYRRCVVKIYIVKRVQRIEILEDLKKNILVVSPAMFTYLHQSGIYNRLNFKTAIILHMSSFLVTIIDFGVLGRKILHIKGTPKIYSWWI